jgi:4-hydroxythreonine-4-phosphate dehydrogenase
MYGHIDGIATAPLSKTEIIDCGFSDIGHTEILKRVANIEDTHMAFVGSKFNVVLATGHASVSKAITQLDERRLLSAISAANQLIPLLPSRKTKHTIALLGLNPHAGEGGLIGHEEVEYFDKALKKANKMDISIEGPLVPDAAFLEENWKKYSAFVCPLHDQGLIPFKMIHARSGGVHITLGLPFIRTSVDHGTAKNIFGKNIADPSSMLEAIKWAIRLARNSMNTSTKARTTKKKGSGQ